MLVLPHSTAPEGKDDVLNDTVTRAAKVPKLETPHNGKAMGIQAQDHTPLLEREKVSYEYAKFSEAYSSVKKP